MQETRVQSLGGEDPLEKEMALQYSYLENPMDKGAWRATVQGVAKSRTQQQLHTHKHSLCCKFKLDSVMGCLQYTLQIVNTQRIILVFCL